jgi:hypothetical protein
VYAYFGHHKAGSTWFTDICRDVARQLGLRFSVVFETRFLDRPLRDHLAAERTEFLVLANADYAEVAALPFASAVHLVRDPRDILVSAYFSHLRSHPTHGWPELDEHRTRLQSVSKAQGIDLEFDFSRRFLDQMRSWPPQVDGVVEVKLEDLTRSPFQGVLDVFSRLGLVMDGGVTERDRARFTLQRAARHLGHAVGVRLPAAAHLPAERVLGIVWEHDFSRKTGGRVRGVEDQSSHYRKGQPGDWRNHLSPAQIDRFKREFGDLLVRYGYETDEAW